MPTVDRIDCLRVVIYPNDHRPAHVHAMGNGCEALFNLNCQGGTPELRENYGFSQAEVGRIQRTLRKRLALICAEWSKIHGSA